MVDKPSASNHALQPNFIIWAVVCSFLVHALLAITLPNISFDAVKEKPIELKIEILQPVQPIIVPIPLAEPIKPQTDIPKPKEILAPKPKPLKKTQPINKPNELPISRPDISPSPDTAPITQQPAQLDPLPPVIAVAPKAESAPEIVSEVKVPPNPAPIVAPVVEPPPAPSEQDLNAALGQYNSTLFRAFAKHKQYPKIAQMRGWQGQCVLEIKIDSAGNVQSTRVKESSGFDALDNQAIEMSKKAIPFPAPPNVLQGRSFTISVPILFKLE